MDRSQFTAPQQGDLITIRGVDGRHGPFEHVAFVPCPLAGEPELAAGTWKAIATARAALGRLEQVALQVPEPTLLHRPTLRREAQSTSALEGTFAPLDEVLLGEVGGVPLTNEVTEVLNYVRAADHTFDTLREGRPLTAALLLEAHRLLVEGTKADGRDAGSFRSIQVAIGSAGARVDEARFIPMPPGPDLESAVRDLLAWIKAPAGDREPVLAAAMAHYQFETIHPFNDGNGRIGRLLVVLQLMAVGALPEPLLSISPWFEQRRPEYQDRLLAVSTRGDWDGWVSMFAEGLAASADVTAGMARDLLTLQEEFEVRLREAGSGGIVRDIARDLIGRPFLDVSGTASRIDVTFAAVNRAVARLVELGILREITGRGKGRVFACDAVLRVLTRP